MRLWFLLEVEMLPPPRKKEIASIERNTDGCGYGPQIECPSAAKLLHSLKPKDAFILLGCTMEKKTLILTHTHTLTSHPHP
mmetsp:Transcript_72817/g.144721  ORF Transcript_72817/g.144721 Transcript_72817/m.144721 type:complete len:81 (-) Transcript_72817:1182-1424(-)